jgi:hypothetical protein
MLEEYIYQLTDLVNTPVSNISLATPAFKYIWEVCVAGLRFELPVMSPPGQGVPLTLHVLSGCTSVVAASVAAWCLIQP